MNTMYNMVEKAIKIEKRHESLSILRETPKTRDERYSYCNETYLMLQNMQKNWARRK